MIHHNYVVLFEREIVKINEKIVCVVIHFLNRIRNICRAKIPCDVSSQRKSDKMDESIIACTLQLSDFLLFGHGIGF